MTHEREETNRVGCRRVVREGWMLMELVDRAENGGGYCVAREEGAGGLSYGGGRGAKRESVGGIAEY
jgi:hypothetical protein